MIKKATLFSILLMFCALVCLQKIAAQDVFIKIYDSQGVLIEGESEDKNHTKEIQPSSFGQESIGCADPTQGTACKAVAGNFIFNMDIGKSIIALKKALFTGEVLKSVDIVFRKAGGTQLEYYKIRLEDVIVRHVTDAASGAPPTHQIELNAVRFGWKYIGQKADGSADTPLKFGWNAATNTEWTSF